MNSICKCIYISDANLYKLYTMICCPNGIQINIALRSTNAMNKILQHTHTHTHKLKPCWKIKPRSNVDSAGPPSMEESSSFAVVTSIVKSSRAQEQAYSIYILWRNKPSECVQFCVRTIRNSNCQCCCCRLWKFAEAPNNVSRKKHMCDVRG